MNEFAYIIKVRFREFHGNAKKCLDLPNGVRGSLCLCHIIAANDAI